MNVKKWIPLVLALALGMTAAMMAWQMSMNQRRAMAKSALGHRVVVVSDNIAPGTPIKAENLTLAPVGGARPDGAFDQVEHLAGRVARTQLIKGQILTESLLAAQGASGGLEALVPPGMRAITVEINEFSGLAGMLTPGSHVDVIANVHDPEGKGIMSRAIVQNAQITAVGQKLASGCEGADLQALKSVTLLVSMRDAEAIHVASGGGQLWMVLRGMGDSQIESCDGVTLAELHGKRQDAPAQVAKMDSLSFLAGLFNAPHPAPVQPAPQAQQAKSEPTASAAPIVQQRQVQVIRQGQSTMVKMDLPTPTRYSHVPLESESSLEQ